MKHFALLAAALLVTSACSSDPDDKETPDAGQTTPDAGDTTPDAGDTTPDAGDTTPDAGEEPELSPPGGSCQSNADCAGEGAVCRRDFAGGYCFVPGCTLGGSDCPEGSVCIEFSGGNNYCLSSCEEDSDCRESEGYFCDVDNTCWTDETVPVDYEPVVPGGDPIGAPCTTGDSCESGACIPEVSDGEPTGYEGGYCSYLCDSEAAMPCPAGAVCGGGLCLDACTEDEDCREGYECLAGTCEPLPPPPPDLSNVNFGANCTEETELDDCGENGLCALGSAWPNGYCVAQGCDLGGDQCGENGTCVEFASENTFCLEACETSSDCRESDGFQCIEGACQFPTANDPALIDIGAACATNADCNLEGGTGGLCIPEEIIDGVTYFSAGFCVAPGCTPADEDSAIVDSCGEGALCVALEFAPFRHCVQSCESDADCRLDDGYMCDYDNTCYSYPCEDDLDCWDGEVCVNNYCRAEVVPE